MMYYIRLSLVLLIIAGVATGILAFINSKTEPIIKANTLKAEEEARKEVLPEATKFDSIGVINDKSAYKALDDNGNIVGYTFLAKKYGYSSDVKTMVGIKASDFTINSIKILSQAETPGLGANCEKSDPVNPEKPAWTTKQFDGKSQADMKVDKDGGPIVSITGATITSRTIANSIDEGMKELKKIIPVGGVR